VGHKSYAQVNYPMETGLKPHIAHVIAVKTHTAISTQGLENIKMEGKSSASLDRGRNQKQGCSVATA
jgi:hypothetical protein